MKKFILIAAFVSICFGCIACNNKPNKDSILTIVKDKTYPILFDFSNVDTIIYVETNDKFCVLHYCDYDVFDYDNLAYLTGREHWYGEYISISVDDTIITEFLNDYYKYLTSTEYEERVELSNKYIIVEEDIKYNNDERDIIFFVRSNIKKQLKY